MILLIRCTSYYGTPTMYIDLINHKNLIDYDLSSMSVGKLNINNQKIDINYLSNMKRVNGRFNLSSRSSPRSC